MVTLHLCFHTQTGSRQTAARRLSGYLNYLEQDALASGCGLFSALADRVSRRTAMDDLLAHTSNRVNYHRLVLAPDSAVCSADLRAWTRALLGALAEAQGMTLPWYAAVHCQAGQPHVHVVLAGAGEYHETGQRVPVRLGPAEYAWLAARMCALSASEGSRPARCGGRASEVSL